MKRERRRSTNPKLTVMDLFCGAGGFSEGFRQLGFDIVCGVDHWEPAVQTFNYNFDLRCERKEMLDFEKDMPAIEGLPDTNIIIGSPPCVSFSMSNRMGGADKTLGLRLMKTFLRIIAIKKYKQDTVLKAWFMENVPNAAIYLEEAYTFADLNLSSWAVENGYRKDDVAINLRNRVVVLNASALGVPQERRRLFAGEIMGVKDFPSLTGVPYNRLRSYAIPSVAHVKSELPSPFSKLSKQRVSDPIYPISISKCRLTDHFYDTGLLKAHWLDAKYLKQDHPYMGRMAFPENEGRPSRTIIASKFAAARETIIYKSEINRSGNGEYRMPTVREAATLMSFPITYQFCGPESTKWALVGNAVCPLVSAAMAQAVLKHIHRGTKRQPALKRTVRLLNVPNLNSFKPKMFAKPPNRNPGARFRRHPFKDGNMTVTLSNYDIATGGKYDGKWRISVMYGTGKHFEVQRFHARSLNRIKTTIKRAFRDGASFIREVDGTIGKRVPKSHELQRSYEKRSGTHTFDEPVGLVDKVKQLVATYANGELCEPGHSKIFKKKRVPKRQLYSLYALSVIGKRANR